MQPMFRQSSIDRLAEADKIDDYVRGVKAGRWMVLLVVALLVLALVSMVAYVLANASDLAQAVESPVAKSVLTFIAG